MTWAYYNEFDPQAAAWIRELIKEGHVAPGEVDERSIEDVCPADLRGFTQVHMFAGIAGWSAALRRAGVPDSRRVWTGSAPCQPFSTAGEGAGFADERHLWPHFYHLIRVSRPAEVFGEQVASRKSEPWIDLVQADLEALDYAFGCVSFPSAGIGAPHLRDRAYWVADTDSPGPQGSADGWGARPGREGRAIERDGAPGRLADPYGGRRAEGRPWAGRGLPDADGASGGLGHANGVGAGRDAGAGAGPKGGAGMRSVGDAAGAPGAAAGQLADTARGGRPGGCGSDGGHLAGHGPADHGVMDAGGRPGPTNGFWRDADWLFCRDEKWRPVEPGTFPLADGVHGRVALLRGAGNAINVEAAKAFIQAYYGSR